MDHLPTHRPTAATRWLDEAAEGVISTAIAVLILAFVGAGMYVGFTNLSTSACEAATDQMPGGASCSE